MPVTERVRCAVIGAGGFAELCHVPGLQSHPRAEVVLLCGRNEARCRAMAARLGVPETAADYREVVARPDIDAITITTPNASHAEIALAALHAGKHVLCEKPLAMDTREAEAMLQVAQERKLIHQVAFTFRYTFPVAELRRRVREGAVEVNPYGSVVPGDRVHQTAGLKTGRKDHSDAVALPQLLPVRSRRRPAQRQINSAVFYVPCHRFPLILKGEFLPPPPR
jgi:hypothetical protein